MRSMRFNTLAWRSWESWFLLGATLYLALMLNQSLGIAASTPVFPIMLILMPLLMVFLGQVARLAGSHCLHMAVFMVLIGGIGLLLGVRLEFGPNGLLGLSGWCSVLPAPSLDAALTKATIAPLTYGGMLLGCNLGMAFSSGLYRQTRDGLRTTLLRYLSCNSGMILGMLIAEASLRSLEAAFEATPDAVSMLSTMFAGMIVGMWAGWWLVEQIAWDLSPCAHRRASERP